jgi:hypothetical protein
VPDGEQPHRILDLGGVVRGIQMVGLKVLWVRAKQVTQMPRVTLGCLRMRQMQGVVEVAVESGWVLFGRVAFHALHGRLAIDDVASLHGFAGMIERAVLDHEVAALIVLEGHLVNFSGKYVLVAGLPSPPTLSSEEKPWTAPIFTRSIEP